MIWLALSLIGVLVGCGVLAVSSFASTVLREKIGD